MAESIKVFENSLRDYLVNAQQDSYHGAGKIEYRYNNLKVYMEPKKNKTPHFYVSLSISEACYMINPVEKLSGSMGTDERFIVMWANRPNINGELRKHWAYLQKAATIELEGLVEQQNQQKIIINRLAKKTQEILDEDAAKVASEAVTGAGVMDKSQGAIESEASEGLTGTGLKNKKSTEQQNGKNKRG